MGIPGYVALKIQYRQVLYYADWTNTRRKYRLNSLTPKTIADLQRVFNGTTTVLIVHKYSSLLLLKRLLGPINTTTCINMKNTGTAAKILSGYLSRNGKNRSYYNYQRDHWLSIFSVVNIHLMLKSSLPASHVLKIIERELVKYKRDITPVMLFEKYMDMGLYVTVSRDPIHNEPIVSLPSKSTERTLA